jgi:hypothetical protein
MVGLLIVGKRPAQKHRFFAARVFPLGCKIHLTTAYPQMRFSEKSLSAKPFSSWHRSKHLLAMALGHRIKGDST